MLFKISNSWNAPPSQAAAPSLGEDNTNANSKTIDLPQAFKAVEALVKPSRSPVSANLKRCAPTTKVQVHIERNNQEFKCRKEAFIERLQQAKVPQINPLRPLHLLRPHFLLTALLLRLKDGDFSFSPQVQELPIWM